METIGQKPVALFFYFLTICCMYVLVHQNYYQNYLEQRVFYMPTL